MSRRNALPAVLVALCATSGPTFAATPSWLHLSSKAGHLPPPNAGTQQTACLVLDIDKDGIDDFVIAERTESPSVVWYKYQGEHRWGRRVVEKEPLRIEAGGDFLDIDGDGDLDVVFAGDSRSDGVWWWENPFPKYEPDVPWKRRTIKSGDAARYQHDCRFGDFDGDGRPELAWWSQTAKKLFLARVPAHPRDAASWSYEPIFSYSGAAGHEGMDVADINLDGKADLVGAGYWFEHQGGTRFVPRRIADRPFTRTAVGQLVPGGRPEVVLCPGDADGPLAWYAWDGRAWIAHELCPNLFHGHSLQVRDINADGHLDIFAAEMGKPGAGPRGKTHIYWGDGAGRFVEQVIAVGKANHESKLGDLDGDGRWDIVGKPYSFETPLLHVWLQRSSP